MNVVFLSTGRCGVSWVGDIIAQIYYRLYGKEIKINYEVDRIEASHKIISGWNGLYDIDPKILINLGYDKILIIKRKHKTLERVHAHYQGYLEQYGSLEHMKELRPAFFEKLALYYKLLYEQEEVNIHPNVLLVSLEDLNNYTYSSFNEIIEFLGFKLSFIQKLKYFLRVLKDKIRPFVVPVNPEYRNWKIYSALLPKGRELCNRLQYLNKIEVKN